MRLRHKLIAAYTLFMFLLAIVAGIAYRSYTIQKYVASESKNLEVIAGNITKNMEITIKSMEDVMHYFLSDTEVLQALRTLSSVDKNDPSMISYRERAKSIIRTKLNTDYIMNNFYRVIVFNQSGDSISSNDFGNTLLNPNILWNDLPWINTIIGTKGSSVLIPARRDDWGFKQSPSVLSLVKEIQGDRQGFIEVQKKEADFHNLFQLPSDGIYISVSYQDQTVYSDVSSVSSSKKDLRYRLDTSSSGITVTVCESYDYFLSTLPNVLGMTFGIVGCFFLVSLLFIILISNRLTRPLNELQNTLEHLQPEELPLSKTSLSKNDELQAISRSFENLMARLDASMQREKRLSLLQIQAQFDLLQTQINPHFLYNVLNVISNRGVENEDETLCEMCGCLASMLRYSLNTKERYATISDELDYLKQYFFLLKCRYTHKLEYSIDVENSIHQEIVPKIILQQFVENSVSHGFSNITGIKRISVSGWTEQGWWYLKVSDNGCGFSPDILVKLKAEMENIRRTLTSNNASMDTEIGGLGLVNTYARMYLIYGGQFVFEFQNHTGGAQIIIGAPREK